MEIGKKYQWIFEAQEYKINRAGGWSKAAGGYLLW